MAKCGYCERSSLFLLTNPHGLCKQCGEEVRERAGEERARVKEDLISARYLKNLDRRVHHLRRALEGTKELSNYERLGAPRGSPSPKALRAFLEEKLWEALAAQSRSNGATRAAGGDMPGQPGELPAVGREAYPDGRGRMEGTRSVHRHPATFGAWVERSIPARTEDVSSRGLCVRTTALLRPGTRVDVVLEAPEGTVSGEGMVRWAHRSQVDGNSANQAVMGLEFLVPPPELQDYG